MPEGFRHLERGRTPVGGISLAWVRTTTGGESEGNPIVVLHGLGSSSRDLLYLADHPAFGHRQMLFIDAAGHGGSDRPDDWPYAIEAHADAVAALLDSMGLQAVSFVGHSMGGSIGIALASRHSDAVLHLIVAEPNLDPGAGTLSGHIARQGEERFIERGYRALVYQTQREADRGSVVAARFLVTLREASPLALHRSAVSLRAERYPTFRQQLESLAIPRTMIWGALTPPLSPPLADPSIARCVIPNAGHVMVTENPEAFARSIAEGLKVAPSGCH